MSVVPLTRSLSPSRAADYMSCPLKYRLKVVDRLPDKSGPDAARGTAVHAALDQLFTLPAGLRTRAEAEYLVTDAATTLLGDPDIAADIDDPDVWIAEAQTLAARYFDLEDPTRIEPAERELHVSCELDNGLTIHGYIDRLDVAPTGDIRIVDYKTGKAPPEAYEAKAFFQMRFYALAVWRTRGVIPKMLQLMYLGTSEVLRYFPDEADLLATERKVQALWTAIERAYASGDWRPNKSPLCGWCNYQPLCPAWGGTPPPLPN